MRFSAIVGIFLVAVVSADHVPGHDGSTSLDVDYETVTRIIEALKTPKPASSTEPEQSTQANLESTDENLPKDSEVPEDSFQKRKQLYLAQYHSKPVIETAVQQPDHEEPCYDGFDGHVEIVEEEDEHPGFVGSIRGIPGVDYPDFAEIPLTSFSCADKRANGFYADVETDCQVFHVCYPHRRESFLCPVGTTFNQPILACDYWYSSNCSAAPDYFDVEEELEPETVEDIVEELVSHVEVEPSEPSVEYSTETPETFTVIIEPAEHTYSPDIPEPVEPKPVPLEVHVEKQVHATLHPPEVESVKIQTPDIAAMTKFLPVKAKVKAFSTPLKAAAFKTKLVAKPKAVKLAAGKVLVAKGKATAVKAVPVAKLVKAAAAKAVVGKAKLAIPIVKTMAAKKIVKTAKAKAAKVLVKSSLAVSPQTKKQLALSLIRMMKAQKLRNLGGVSHARFYF